MLTNNKWTSLIRISLLSSLILSPSQSKPCEPRLSDQLDTPMTSVQELLWHYKAQVGTTVTLLFHELLRPTISPFSQGIEINNRKVLNPVPEHLRSVLAKKDRSLTLYSAQLNDFACATEKDIFINNQVLKNKLFSKEAQQFLLSHEIAHLDNNDCRKTALSNIGIIMATPVVLAAYDHYSGKLFDYVLSKLDNESTGHAVIQSIKKVNSMVASSSITQSLITFFLQSCYSRHREKQADLAAAHTTNAQSGAQFALTLSIIGQREKSSEMSFVKQLSKKLRESKLLASHPSPAKRFTYLVDLAAQQSGSPREDIVNQVVAQVSHQPS